MNKKLSPLRQKVLDYMKMNSQIEWTPEKSFILYNPGQNGCTTFFGVFFAGEKYYGLPYINIAMCQPETYEKMREGGYIPFNGTDEELRKITCIKDLKEIGGETLDTAIKNAFTFPGNDCILAVLLAWNTVINNREEVQNMQYCLNMIPGQNNGVAAVGEYNYCNNFDNNTDMITADNGEQTMAKAYSCAQPGDATTYIRQANGNARHVRMVYDYPHVEYTTNENGEKIIDMDKSYLTLLDQAGGAVARYIVGENKSSCHINQYPFRRLYTEGSLPISIPELINDSSDKTNTYTESLDLSALTSGKISGWVRSNRQIISIRATISDGENVYDCPADIKLKIGFKANYHLSSYDLSELDLSSVKFESGKKYTFNLYALVSGMDGKETELVNYYSFKV